MSTDPAHELAEVRAKIALTEAKINAVLRRNRLEGILEQLYIDKNRLAGTKSCKESFAFSHFIVSSQRSLTRVMEEVRKQYLTRIDIQYECFCILGSDLHKFPFMSGYLAYLGMSTPYEQYTFYGTTLAFVAGSVGPLRRAYFLNKYLHETEEGIKDIWAMRGGFNEVELKGGHRLLEIYRKTRRFSR